MAKRKRNMPHKIDDDSWWYEDKKGIEVVVHGKIVSINWSLLLAAYARQGMDDKTWQAFNEATKRK